MKLKSFSIKNYRSLKDITIKEFGNTTIIYGDNNVGKSNVLNALYIIFKRKAQFDEAVKDITPDKNFYEGVIDNFVFDFFNDTKDDIEFEVNALIENKELILFKKTIRNLLSKNYQNEDKIVKFKGRIFRSTRRDKSAEIIFENISINSNIIYENKTEVLYFPTLDKLKKNQSEYRKEFEYFVEQFNDCVTLILSSRDMLPTYYIDKDEKISEINSTTFKVFLQKLYLGIETHSIFEKINDVFNKPPFKFGDISFAHINNELEIMIKEGNTRLPIKHFGSGVLQILYILTLIVDSKSKIFCIEELEQNISPINQNLALRKLQEFLKINSTTLLHQLILSTHSRVFYNAKLFDKIYWFKRENFETKIIDISSEKNKISKKVDKRTKKEKISQEDNKISKEFDNFVAGIPTKTSKDQKRQSKYAY